jgi:hypothetical protein
MTTSAALFFGLDPDQSRLPARFTWDQMSALPRLCLGLSFLLACVGTPMAQPAIPDFSGAGWQGIGNDLNAPAAGPGPVTFDPLHPYVSNAEAARTGKQPNFRVADLSNPILLPATREALRRQNEEVFSGKVVFTRESRC